VRIAIVGAGPAGCHLAHLLTDTEHEILLFDDRAPYEKPCGGGLSPLIGKRFPDVMTLPFPRHRPPCLVLRSSDGGEVKQALDSSDWAIVSRMDFGRALLDRALANGRVHHVRQRVTTIESEGERWSLRTATGETFSADFLVGADGVRSLVRREIAGPIPRQHLGIAVGYRVRGVPDAIMFQTYADLEGYLWSFPRADHASVGIATRLGAVAPRDLWQRLDQFLDEVCAEADKLDRYSALLPMAHDIGLWDYPCAGPNWALLGDAAGHVHPLTGEGIAYALWSAELLDDSLVHRGPLAYEGLWQEQYGNRMRAASTMLSNSGPRPGGYEIAFQIVMAVASFDS
jgi:geranylgeranyl reductase family protein